MSDITSEATMLDLRGTLCPINWVKTKLALEELTEGETLEVILDDGEPMRNVPRSVKAEGHRVLGVKEDGDGAYRLTIRRGPS
jgi:TusA-related sulfurtransferase